MMIIRPCHRKRKPFTAWIGVALFSVNCYCCVVTSMLTTAASLQLPMKGKLKSHQPERIKTYRNFQQHTYSKKGNVIRATLVFTVFEHIRYQQQSLQWRKETLPRKQLVFPTDKVKAARTVTTRLHAIPTLTSPTTSSLLSKLSLPLISASDNWGNWFVLTSAAAVSQVIGARTSIGRLLGAPVTAMALAFGLATVGVITPGGTVASKSLQYLTLQLSTPLILLGADLRKSSLDRCGPLLVSFTAASLATSVACAAGWMMAGEMLTAAFPSSSDGLILAAALLAKNVGGGINYVAVCSALNASPSAIAAGLCVDNIFALIYFPATSGLASGKPDVCDDDNNSVTIDDNNNTSVGEIKTARQQRFSASSSSSANEMNTTANTFSVQSISTVVFLSTALLWLGERIGGTYAALPTCTVLTVLLASLSPRNWMAPLRPIANRLGMVCLYLFFATAGSPGIAVADSVKSSIRPLGMYLTCLYTIHAIVLTILHYLFRPIFPKAVAPQRLLVASSAAIGGPATAVALAASANWKSLEVPGILVGNVGYAIATFCGLAFHAILMK